MNRAEIRDRVLNRRAWQAQGTKLTTKLNKAINDALNDLADDVPDALSPQEVSVVVLPDVTSGTLSENLKARWTSTEPWLLVFTLSGSTNISAVWSPDTTGLWDLKYWIELTRASTGQTLRRQVHHWAINANVYYAVVDEPLPPGIAYDQDSGSEWTFRLFQPEFWLPSGVIRFHGDIKIRDALPNSTIEATPPQNVRRDLESPYMTQVRGVPEVAYRGPLRELVAARRPPAAVVDPRLSPAPWDGPTRSGTWKVCYTYVMGGVDPALGCATDGTMDPIWESPPSEATSFTVTDTGFLLTGNNIDAQLGFNEPGATLPGHSGTRIRFYVARVAVSGSAGEASHALVESAEEAFYFLAEVNPVDDAISPNGFYASYLWTGKTPDRRRPLIPSAGYYGWHLYPRQEYRHTLDMRVSVRPRPLHHDQDSPPIQPGAIRVLVERALYYAAQLDGADLRAASVYEDKYNKLAQDFRDTVGRPGGPLHTPAFRDEYRYRRPWGTYTESGE